MLDSTQQPIPGTTVFVFLPDGTQVSNETDAEGQFLLTGVPVGPLVLHVDPSSSPRPETFPPLEFEVVAISGIKNTLDRPVILPQINVDMAKIVGGNEDVVLEMKGVPGATLTVFANSATFADGSTTGLASLSQVKINQVPMQPPNGTTLAIATTFQPLGAKYDPPVRVQLPNIDGLPPGTVIEMVQFHHDTSRFEPIGKGTVTEDGRFIVSDPGFGFLTGGWGAAPPPPPPPNCNGGISSSLAASCWALNGNTCKWVPKTTSFGQPIPCEDGNTCTGRGTNGIGTRDVCGGDGTCRPGANMTGPEPCTTACGSGTRCQDGACVVSNAFKPDGFTITATAPNSEITNNTIVVKKGEKITFTPTVTGGSCGGLRYKWQLGDGNQIPQEVATHSYVEPGIYKVGASVACGECPTGFGSEEKITVVVVGVESKDRFVKFTLGAEDDQDIDLTLKSGPNGETLVGAVQNFLHNPTVRIYSSIEEIYSESDDLDKLIDERSAGTLAPVVVVHPPNSKMYDVYTVFDNTGNVQLDITVDNETVSHKITLEADNATKEWIDLIVRLANEISEVAGGPPTSVSAFSAFSVAAAAATETQIGSDRSLIARALAGFLVDGLKISINLVGGIYEGLLQGFRDDLAGLELLGALLSNPVKVYAELSNAISELDGDDIKRVLTQMVSELVRDAEKVSDWRLDPFDPDNPNDQIAVEAYVGGFVFGYLTEQLVVLSTVFGAIPKTAGFVIKTIAKAAKGGQLVVLSATAALRFKVRAAFILSKQSTFILEVPGIVKMARSLGNKPFGTSTVGSFLEQRYVDFQGHFTGLGKIVRKMPGTISAKWNDFGFRFLENFADLTNRISGAPGTLLLEKLAANAFFKLSERLIVAGSLASDRYTDFLKLVKADGLNGTIPTDLINSWLTKFNAATGDKPKFLLEGIERIHQKAFRYANSDTVAVITDQVTGAKRLVVNNGDGWYVTFENSFNTSAEARRALQLPDGSTAKFRIEIDMTPELGKNTKIPYGEFGDAPHLEPITRDFPGNGGPGPTGGATQVLIENVEVPIKAIWDISGPTPIQVFP